MAFLAARTSTNRSSQEAIKNTPPRSKTAFWRSEASKIIQDKGWRSRRYKSSSRQSGRYERPICHSGSGWFRKPPTTATSPGNGEGTHCPHSKLHPMLCSKQYGIYRADGRYAPFWIVKRAIYKVEFSAGRKTGHLWFFNFEAAWRVKTRQSMTAGKPVCRESWRAGGQEIPAISRIQRHQAFCIGNTINRLLNNGAAGGGPGRRCSQRFPAAWAASALNSASGSQNLCGGVEN